MRQTPGTQRFWRETLAAMARQSLRQASSTHARAPVQRLARREEMSLRRRRRRSVRVRNSSGRFALIMAQGPAGHTRPRTARLALIRAQVGEPAGHTRPRAGLIAVQVRRLACRMQPCAAHTRAQPVSSHTRPRTALTGAQVREPAGHTRPRTARLALILAQVREPVG